MKLPNPMHPKKLRAVVARLSEGTVCFEPEVVQALIEHADAQAVFLREAAKELTRNRIELEELRRNKLRLEGYLIKEKNISQNKDIKEMDRLKSEASRLLSLNQHNHDVHAKSIEHWKSEANRLAGLANKWKNDFAEAQKIPRYHVSHDRYEFRGQQLEQAIRERELNRQSAEQWRKSYEDMKAIAERRTYEANTYKATIDHKEAELESLTVMWTARFEEFRRASAP